MRLRGGGGRQLLVGRLEVGLLLKEEEMKASWRDCRLMGGGPMRVRAWAAKDAPLASPT